MPKISLIREKIWVNKDLVFKAESPLRRLKGFYQLKVGKLVIHSNITDDLPFSYCAVIFNCVSILP